MNKCKKLAAALNAFRALDPNLPLSVILTYLEVGDHTDIEVRELPGRTGLSVPSINRALTYLGEHHWSKKPGKPGLQLVEQSVSPEDMRVRVATLTPKGRALKQSLEEILS